MHTLTRLAKKWGLALLSFTMVTGLMAPVAYAATEEGASPPSTLKITANGRIAFVNEDQIWTIKSGGKDLVKLTTGSGKKSGPAYSPNGKQIAYVNKTASGVSDLWMMNADGSNKTQVTTTGHISPGGPAWAPNGKRLAFGGPCVTEEPGDDEYCGDYLGTEMYGLDTISAVAPYDSLKTLQTCESAGCEHWEKSWADVIDRVTWSPLGGELAFYSHSYSINADNYTLVYTFEDDLLRNFDTINGTGYGFGNQGYPVFSPDRTLFAYDSFRDEQGYTEHKGIQMCNYPEKSVCNMFTQDRQDTQLAFAPMMNKTVFTNTKDSTKKLYTADMTGNNRVFLTNGKMANWQPVE